MPVFNILIGKNIALKNDLPVLLGTQEADTFPEACELFFSKLASKDNPNGQQLVGLYDKESNTFWGSRLYSDDIAAMIEFGGSHLN